ncbi:MAG: cytochrome D1 domain-containing protein [Gammaproteobacteria bacterium]
MSLLIAHGSWAAPQKANQAPDPAGKRMIVQEGIAIEFSMQLPRAGNRSSGKFREGDDVAFRYTITNTATGSPLTGARPAAWMSLRGETGEARTCREIVQGVLSGSLFSQAELDLNAYYVLALNDDATITVVDPLYGFGGSKLLALVSLKSPGEDWVLTADEERLFVSLPESNQIAVIDTTSWKPIMNLEVGTRPSQLALQPDQRYLWVAHGADGSSAKDPGVTVITAGELGIAARISTGRGPHQIALSDDDHFAFVSNRAEGTVSIIDVRELRKIRDIITGREPASVAFSPLSKMAYVVNEGDGTLVVIDGNRPGIVARVPAEPGLGQIGFAPGGRLGFVVNPEKDLVHILDAATNRIVQTGDVEDGPDQVAFSKDLAYIRHRGSETVLMIPLTQVGVEGKPVPVVAFPGGQNPFGKAARPSPADAIVQAPGANAVLVANPADKAIYFYQEGMAAPMGSFSNYSREPRAVLVVDRSLRERSPGIYETTARLGRAGLYDVAFLLDAPPRVHCFEVAVEPNPDLAQTGKGPSVAIVPLATSRVVPVGERVRLQFKLIDPDTKQAKAGLNDVRALTFLAPGIWQRRHLAQPVSEGVYEIEFVPPQPGIYYVYIECPTLGLGLNNPQYLVLEAQSVE